MFTRGKLILLARIHRHLRPTQTRLLITIIQRSRMISLATHTHTHTSIFAFEPFERIFIYRYFILFHFFTKIKCDVLFYNQLTTSICLNCRKQQLAKLQVAVSISETSKLLSLMNSSRWQSATIRVTTRGSWLLNLTSTYSSTL